MPFVKDILTADDMYNFKWPKKSPDLNILTEFWEVLEEKIYRDGNCYEKISKLKQALREAWSEISLDVIRRRIEDYPEVLRDITQAGGHFVNF